jgi:ATP-dependent Clp protease ATP-binding subunit ClpC
MGARPLRRAIQRYIEDPLADFVLRSELNPGQIVLADVPQGPENDGAEIELTLLDGAPALVGADGGPQSEDSHDGGDAPPAEQASE